MEGKPTIYAERLEINNWVYQRSITQGTAFWHLVEKSSVCAIAYLVYYDDVCMYICRDPAKLELTLDVTPSFESLTTLNV